VRRGFVAACFGVFFLFFIVGRCRGLILLSSSGN
jgi:hypothetical protein